MISSFRQYFTFKTNFSVSAPHWPYNPANISCFPRRLENVFSITLFVFQDVLKTSWRRLQDIFTIRLPKTSSRRLQVVFARRLAIISSRRLQDVLEDKKMLHWRRLTRLQDVFKASSVRLHQGECLLGTYCNAWDFIKWKFDQ